MISSTCCFAFDEQVNVNDLQTTYKCCGNSMQGLKADTAVKTNGTTRRKREFTPDEQKDDNYWLKRSRNNEAAKRSRQRKRVEEHLLEARAVELLRENEKLKAALSAVHYHGLGVQYPLGTIMENPLTQELPRDVYLRSLVDFSGPAPLAPLTETSCSSYALSGRCRSDSQTHRFSTACDSVSLGGMTTAPTIPTVALMENGRERGGNIWRIPACSGVCSPGNTLMPFAYEVSQRKGMHINALSTMASSPNSSAGISNYSRAATAVPDRDTHVLMDKPSDEDRAPAITEAKSIRKELTTITQTERVSVSPRLPHKLRYKVNKVTHGEKDSWITRAPHSGDSNHAV